MEPTQLKSKFGRRLAMIFVIIISGVIVTLLSFYIGLKSSLIDVKQLHSQDLATTAVAVAKHFHQLSKNGKLSEAVARQRSLNVIKDMKFSKSGYYWVSNGDGVMLMHPYTYKMVGVNLSLIKNEDGTYRYPNFIRVGKSGGGIIQYNWAKPNQQNTEETKLTYVAYFEPWDWIIGTGVYINDLEESIERYAFRAIAVVIFFTLIFSITAIEFTRRLIDELRKKAIRDPLTSLYSRRYLNESLSDFELKMRRDKQLTLAILFIDIDHFKNVNDTYGHKVGDDVIATVGQIMLKESRPDDLCIRYGGEEFLILTISETPDTANILANRIRESVAKHPITVQSNTIMVTLSIGIAYHLASEAIERAIDRADKNLYYAKENGRNQVICDTDMSLL